MNVDMDIDMDVDIDKDTFMKEKCQQIISGLLEIEENNTCADCHVKGTKWSSWNLGIFLCIRCARIHRNLGVHISRVKSINLDVWNASQVAHLQHMGNSKARAVYEANLPENFKRPQTDSALEAFVRAKYEHKKYIAREWKQPDTLQPAFDIDVEMKKEKDRKSKNKAKLLAYVPKVELEMSKLFEKIKPKKKGKGKTSHASQVAELKEERVDLTSPDSILAHTNLRSLLNKQTFYSLPLYYQYKLVQLIPKFDQDVTPEGWIKPSSTALSNEFFTKSCNSWLESLSEGRMTLEAKQKRKIEIEKEKNKLDPWKLKNFEPIWGQPLVSQSDFDTQFERSPQSSSKKLMSSSLSVHESADADEMEVIQLKRRHSSKRTRHHAKRKASCTVSCAPEDDEEQQLLSATINGIINGSNNDCIDNSVIVDNEDSVVNQIMTEQRIEIDMEEQNLCVNEEQEVVSGTPLVMTTPAATESSSSRVVNSKSFNLPSIINEVPEIVRKVNIPVVSLTPTSANDVRIPKVNTVILPVNVNMSHSSNKTITCSDELQLNIMKPVENESKDNSNDNSCDGSVNSMSSVKNGDKDEPNSKSKSIKRKRSVTLAKNEKGIDEQRSFEICRKALESSPNNKMFYVSKKRRIHNVSLNNEAHGQLETLSQSNKEENQNAIVMQQQRDNKDKTSVCVTTASTSMACSKESVIVMTNTCSPSSQGNKASTIKWAPAVSSLPSQPIQSPNKRNQVLTLVSPMKMKENVNKRNEDENIEPQTLSPNKHSIQQQQQQQQQLQVSNEDISCHKTPDINLINHEQLNQRKGKSVITTSSSPSSIHYSNLSPIRHSSISPSSSPQLATILRLSAKLPSGLTIMPINMSNNEVPVITTGAASQLSPPQTIQSQLSPSFILVPNMPNCSTETRVVSCESLGSVNSINSLLPTQTLTFHENKHANVNITHHDHNMTHDLQKGQRSSGMQMNLVGETLTHTHLPSQITVIPINSCASPAPQVTSLVATIPSLSIPSSNADGYYCTGNHAALITCMKCGAYCHGDCIGPGKLCSQCVTCFVR